MNEIKEQGLQWNWDRNSLVYSECLNSMSKSKPLVSRCACPNSAVTIDSKPWVMIFNCISEYSISKNVNAHCSWAINMLRTVITAILQRIPVDILKTLSEYNISADSWRMRSKSKDCNEIEICIHSCILNTIILERFSAVAGIMRYAG